MNNELVWNNIPLEDYEAHMSAAQVGQQQLLNSLTQKYLDKLKPETFICLGVAGGNGLEHVDNKVTTNVIVVDINDGYLAKTSERYAHSIHKLVTVHADIATCSSGIAKANLIWAALVFEYTGVAEGLTFCANNIAHGGSLVITIQSDNGVTTVTNTGIETIKQAGSVFTAIEPLMLIAAAEKSGLKLLEQEENFLPNGKSMKTFLFSYKK